MWIVNLNDPTKKFYEIPYEVDESSLEDVLHSKAEHQHKWKTCTHIGVDFAGNHKLCEEKSDFERYEHDLCVSCSKRRYEDQWIKKVESILNKRDLVLSYNLKLRNS